MIVHSYFQTERVKFGVITIITIICAHCSDQAQIHTQIDASFSRMTSVWQDLGMQRKSTEVLFSLLVLLFSFVLCNW